MGGKHGLVLLGLSLAACSTNLQSERLPAEARKDWWGRQHGAEGLVYFLKARNFQIDVDFEITDCRVENGKPVIDYVAHSKVTSAIQSDPSQAYYIRYEDLDAWTKITSGRFELYDSATLKSINGSADDRSGEIAATVVSAAAKIALSAATAGVGAPKLPAAQTYLKLNGLPSSQQKTGLPKRDNALCNNELLAKLDEIDKLRRDLVKDQVNDIDAYRARKELDEAQELYKAALAAAKVAQDSKVPAAIEAAAEEVSAALNKVNAAKAKADAAKLAAPKTQKEIEAIRSTYRVHSASAFWQPTPGAAREISINLPREVEDMLLSDRGRAVRGATPLMTVEAKLLVADTQKAQALLDDGNGDAVRGLKYRQPLPGRLVLCKPKCDAAKVTENAIADENVIAVQSYAMPQFGTLAVLPLNNGIFAKNNIEASWNDDGALVSVKYASESAGKSAADSLDQAGGSLLDAATKLADLRQQQREQELKNRLADLEAAEKFADFRDAQRTRALQSEIDILEARKKRQELIKDINGTPDIEAIERRTAVFEALAREAEARKRYEQALSGL